MTSRSRTVLTTCLVALSCSTQPADMPADPAAPNRASVEFRADRPSELEVKRAPTGHLLVRPKLDGADAGYWIFDSGAGICCVSTPALPSLHLRPAGAVEAIGIGGAATAPTYLVDQLELGPLLLRDHPLLATDLSFLTQHLGETITGVIGYGVLSRCVVEFDFVAPRLALHDPAHYGLTGTTWAPLNLDGRTPAVTARIEGHEGLFQIDTGQNSAVVCSPATVAAWHLVDRPGLRDAQVSGVGGAIAAKAGTFDWIEFGGVRQERVDAMFLLEAKGSRSSTARAGAIGAALLRPFVMVTDYGRQRISFRPRS